MQTPSWTLEFKQAYRSLPELFHFLGFPLSSELEKVANKYPVFIPKRLAEKIKAQGLNGVLAKEFLPDPRELESGGSEDPIGDERFNVAPQLIHRYPSRVLFAPTTVCPIHCRYCFRKNELYEQNEIFKADFEKTLTYLRDHTEVSELIFTGGDPFSLSDEKLRYFLDAFALIPTLKDIRFHTRYPVILPQRFDQKLLGLLSESSKNFRTLTIGVHANHVSEFDSESKAAVQALSKTGVQLLSQTVLLKDINDQLPTLLKLFDLFIDLKIRPYYLHHPDQVKGGMHFYVPLTRGREIYRELRSSLPGWAIPQYVVDLPGGEGKTLAFNPEEATSHQFLTLNGQSFTYSEPQS